MVDKIPGVDLSESYANVQKEYTKFSENINDLINEDLSGDLDYLFYNTKLGTWIDKNSTFSDEWKEKIEKAGSTVSIDEYTGKLNNKLDNWHYDKFGYYGPESEYEILKNHQAEIDERMSDYISLFLDGDIQDGIANRALLVDTIEEEIANLDTYYQEDFKEYVNKIKNAKSMDELNEILLDYNKALNQMVTDKENELNDLREKLKTLRSGIDFKEIEETKAEIQRLESEKKSFENILNTSKALLYQYKSCKTTVENNFVLEEYQKGLKEGFNEYFTPDMQTELLIDIIANNTFTDDTQMIEYYSEKLEELYLDYLKNNCDVNTNHYEESNYLSDDVKEYISETEKLTYEYIYNTRGENAANEYLRCLKQTLNERLGKKLADDFIQEYEANGGHLTTVALEGLQDGLKQYADGLESWFTADKALDPNDFKMQYICQYFNSDQKFMELHESTYQMAISMGNMLPSIGISIAVSLLTKLPIPSSLGTVGNTLKALKDVKDLAQIASAISIFASTGGNAFDQALADGFDISTSLVMGVLSGASEAALESLLGAIPGIGVFEKNFLLSIFYEGAQEYIQSYVDEGINALGYLMDGKDYELDLGSLSEDALKSFIFGAVMGGVFKGAEFTGNIVVNGVKIGLSDLNMLYILGDPLTVMNDYDSILGFSAFEKEPLNDYLTRRLQENVVGLVESGDYDALSKIFQKMDRTTLNNVIANLDEAGISSIINNGDIKIINQILTGVDGTTLNNIIKKADNELLVHMVENMTTKTFIDTFLDSNTLLEEQNLKKFLGVIQMASFDNVTTKIDFGKVVDELIKDGKNPGLEAFMNSAAANGDWLYKEDPTGKMISDPKKYANICYVSQYLICQGLQAKGALSVLSDYGYPPTINGALQFRADINNQIGAINDANKSYWDAMEKYNKKEGPKPDLKTYQTEIDTSFENIFGKLVKKDGSPFVVDDIADICIAIANENGRTTASIDEFGLSQMQYGENCFLVTGNAFGRGDSFFFVGGGCNLTSVETDSLIYKTFVDGINSGLTGEALIEYYRKQYCIAAAINSPKYLDGMTRIISYDAQGYAFKPYGIMSATYPLEWCLGGYTLGMGDEFMLPGTHIVDGKFDYDHTLFPDHKPGDKYRYEHGVYIKDEHGTIEPTYTYEGDYYEKVGDGYVKSKDGNLIKVSINETVGEDGISYVRAKDGKNQILYTKFTTDSGTEIYATKTSVDGELQLPDGTKIIYDDSTGKMVATDATGKTYEITETSDHYLVDDTGKASKYTDGEFYIRVCRNETETVIEMIESGRLTKEQVDVFKEEVLPALGLTPEEIKNIKPKYKE